MRRLYTCLIIVLAWHMAMAQQLPQDGPLTLRPMLQQLGQRLMQGKQGSIVAIRPSTGEILCLVTNSPKGSNVNLAIATAYAPGSTFKTAQALTLLSEGVVDAQTTIACNNGLTDGNIHVGCHKHASPLNIESALAHSCNTWFLSAFASMINDSFMYTDKAEAIDTWRGYMRSMGLGGPLGIDIPGEKGGLLANAAYLDRRYKDGWDGKTIMWAGMGQGDVTLTPMQLCNLAVTIANRGFFYTPHIHQATPQRPLPARYTQRRQTKVEASAYNIVVRGMRQAVLHGTCTALRAPYPVCGKTGTIENPGKDHSAFIGFAPMDNPQIAIAVYIEHGGFGADLAAPMAGLIIEEYLKGTLTPNAETRAKKIERTRTMN